MIVHAARAVNASVLYSEDLSHGSGSPALRYKILSPEYKSPRDLRLIGWLRPVAEITYARSFQTPAIRCGRTTVLPRRIRAGRRKRPNAPGRSRQSQGFFPGQVLRKSDVGCTEGSVVFQLAGIQIFMERAVRVAALQSEINHVRLLKDGDGPSSTQKDELSWPSARSAGRFRRC